ncbi:MAG: M48 family metallopeptidase [Roseivirga sp.]|uniref:M48 family metallopeptidase n=1 Tax=Roseivirga sp. TaxID=1964215 RepID=UPI001B15DF13|nr:M48 family metallopeptidase [Roseivirga sp.]MBO6496121.1 M48 family metallopeptidase [Roseivirga sp.]
MNPNEWLYLILGIVVVDYVIDQLLDFLNFKHSKTAVPYKLKDLYDEEEYARSQAYQKARSRFEFLTSAFSMLLTMVVLLFGGFGVLDEFLRAYIENPILLSLAFFGVLFILSDIVNTPFSLYSTFVIEERFGFNKTTVKTFVMDKLKGYLLTVIVGGVLGYALLWIVHQLGDNFWLYALALVSAFMLIMNLFYTSLILPLFNKLKPLEDGVLKEKIMAYASGVDFPLDNIFVIDGSKRSTKANAFFSGIGKKKKIVLYDTLIEKHSEEELVAVLAHEVGHFKKKHIVLSLVLSILQMAVTFYVLSLFVFSDNLSVALGGSQMAIHLNFIAFGLLYTPISRLTGLAMNALSRKNEFEADAYAVTTYAGKPLMDALKKLSVSSLSNLTPHPAYVFAHYSHPPLLQRLEAMEELTKGS